MKLALLASGISSHTAKWVHSLSERGHEVHLIAMEPMEEPGDVTVHLLPFKKPWGYYLNAVTLRRLLRKLRPDLLHVHYASGYGTLGRLAGYRPCVLSVWGSDVFNFPYQSKAKFRTIVRNLKHYDQICATSRIMADQVSNLCPEICPAVIPFGVDTKLFTPISQAQRRDHLTLGIIKSLEPKYALDILLKAFAEVCRVGNETNIRLMIVGNGSIEADLKGLAQTLGIADRIDFIDRVPHTDVPSYMNKIDVFVNVSRAESFGVAVLEASACALPVITSDVGGLPEVVVDGTTGMIVPVEDVDTLANAILKLAKDKPLRRRLGENGRAFVKEHYEWSACVDQMEHLYERVLHSAAAHI